MIPSSLETAAANPALVKRWAPLGRQLLANNRLNLSTALIQCQSTRKKFDTSFKCIYLLKLEIKNEVMWPFYRTKNRIWSSSFFPPKILLGSFVLIWKDSLRETGKVWREWEVTAPNNVRIRTQSWYKCSLCLLPPALPKSIMIKNQACNMLLSNFRGKT